LGLGPELRILLAKIAVHRAFAVADWYYIGHYGQLGPLTKDQIEELILGGVIARETYVWCSGFPNWSMAGDVSDLKSSFAMVTTSTPPPPPLTDRPPVAAATTTAPPPAYEPYGAGAFSPAMYQSYMPVVESDRSRIAGGILNLLLPGIGRMYLGYGAIGVIQLLVTLITCGVGWIWPFVDGILMLTGAIKVDGYGRLLKN
jgi:TM2 domain-containing membrane protein YozV